MLYRRIPCIFDFICFSNTPAQWLNPQMSNSEPELTHVNKCVIDQDACMVHSYFIQMINLYKKNLSFININKWYSLPGLNWLKPFKRFKTLIKIYVLYVNKNSINEPTTSWWYPRICLFVLFFTYPVFQQKY